MDQQSSPPAATVTSNGSNGRHEEWGYFAGGSYRRRHSADRGGGNGDWYPVSRRGSMNSSTSSLLFVPETGELISTHEMGGSGNTRRGASARMTRRLSNDSDRSDLPFMSPMSGEGRMLSDDDWSDKSTNFGLRRSRRPFRRGPTSMIFDDPLVVAGYASVPIIEVDSLPRGGLSLETNAVGRIQFGIPPETIKDSMSQGLNVPRVYIVPVERFCLEMGPALGINVAEFEFPAYFNYFVRQKRCTLVVDSTDAENNIRRVFGETLLGPAQYRNHDKPQPNNDEDFDPRYPVERRPNFYKEFQFFRTQEKTPEFDELCLEMLIDFCHFKPSGAQQQHRSGQTAHQKLGVPPPPPSEFLDIMNESEASLSAGKEIYTSLDSSAVDVAYSRRHSTQLDVIDSDSDEENHVEKSGGPLDAKLDKSLKMCGGALCGGCDQCINRMFGSASSLVDLSGEDKEPAILRRVVSDPELRKVCIDDFAASTDSIPAVQEGAGSFTREPLPKPSRRRSIDTMTSNIHTRDGISWASGGSFLIDSENEDDQKRSWMYSRAKWLGEVATVYPHSATPEERATNNTARVEIFKMTGGTEYIIHDIDENNIIVGKARFGGTVRVPDEFEVEGFTTKSDGYASGKLSKGQPKWDGHDSGNLVAGAEEREIPQISISLPVVPPTFHPPSFGVTVLGNSHGFDKEGSVSGYVLWINGRGVMIDPPPYSSATLEREGIRPQMIMAIIITHCHADHDAGAFQKVMTGSRVAVITTPTIYKSFIRKYSALSGLSPALLRHSHRHRPAIVGQPLKFQGATFHFNYTLHTIPCIAFKVQWRGRSMVFTGDHMNIPDKLDNLHEAGVLTKERADDLRRLPLQECDLLLHESGAPPIHTPVEVLLSLPQEVKDRLFVVHTSALPKDCELRVAPTGTAGTIRLDQMDSPFVFNNCDIGETSECDSSNEALSLDQSFRLPKSADPDFINASNHIPNNSGKDTHPKENGFPYSGNRSKGRNNFRERGSFYFDALRSSTRQISFDSSFQNGEGNSIGEGEKARARQIPPLVLLRPTCVSDAWFILNLLSAVPFLSSLSYSNTMEVLEIAQVEVLCEGEVVIPAQRRTEVLCVIWEGTCIERDADQSHSEIPFPPDKYSGVVDRDYGIHREEFDIPRHESPAVWHAGDWTGPKSLQPVCSLSGECDHRGEPKDVVALSSQGVKVIKVSIKDLHKILQTGSLLYRKYQTIQEKRAIEEAAAMKMNNAVREGPSMLQNGIDNAGIRVNNRFIHDTAYNFLEIIGLNSALGKLTALQKRHLESLAEGPRFFEAGQFIWHVGQGVDFAFLIMSGTAAFAPSAQGRSKIISRRGSTGSMSHSERHSLPRFGSSSFISEDKLINVSPNSEYARLEIGLQLRVEEMETGAYEHPTDALPGEERARNARDRFANKVLARLYARQAYTAGLVFSRGHFLSDTSRMVSGSLAFIHGKASPEILEEASQGQRENHVHSSSIAAGHDGCVVMVFPKESLITFFDAHPGVLLSLLGTQIMV